MDILLNTSDLFKTQKIRRKSQLDSFRKKFSLFSNPKQASKRKRKRSTKNRTPLQISDFNAPSKRKPKGKRYFKSLPKNRPKNKENLKTNKNLYFKNVNNSRTRNSRKRKVILDDSKSTNKSVFWGTSGQWTLGNSDQLQRRKTEGPSRSISKQYWKDTNFEVSQGDHRLSAKKAKRPQPKSLFLQHLRKENISKLSTANRLLITKHQNTPNSYAERRKKKLQYINPVKHEIRKSRDSNYSNSGSILNYVITPSTRPKRTSTKAKSQRKTKRQLPPKKQPNFLDSGEIDRIFNNYRLSKSQHRNSRKIKPKSVQNKKIGSSRKSQKRKSSRTRKNSSNRKRASCRGPNNSVNDSQSKTLHIAKGKGH